jgi:hypothetical protein
MLTPSDVRKQSESLLKARGVKINPHLPFIEPIESLAPPDATIVGARCFVLGYLTGVCYEVPTREIASELHKWKLWDFVSSDENQLLGEEEPSRQTRINCGWLTECIQVLAWGLGLAELDHWRECDDDLADRFPLYTDPWEVIIHAHLRPFQEVYQQSDLLYRLHWAVKNSKDRGKNAGLNWEVIQERHKGINWLSGLERDWDEVTTDT